MFNELLCDPPYSVRTPSVFIPPLCSSPSVSIPLSVCPPFFLSHVLQVSFEAIKTKVCPPNMTEKCFEYVKRYFLDGVWIAVLTVSGWCLVGVLRQREYCLNSVWIVVSWFDYIRIVGVLNGWLQDALVSARCLSIRGDVTK